MAAPYSFDPQYSTLYKEARNFIYDYASHNRDYRYNLIERLRKPQQQYVLYPLKTIVYFLLRLAPPKLAIFAKPPFENLHPFLLHFTEKEPYYRLNSIAEGQFRPTDEEVGEDTVFTNLPEEEKDKKIEERVKEKEQRKFTNYDENTVTPTAKPNTNTLENSPEGSILYAARKDFEKRGVYIKPTIPSAPPIRTPSFIKDILLQGNLFIYKVINRYPRITIPGFVGASVGVIQYAVTGQPAIALFSGLGSAVATTVAYNYLSNPRESGEYDEGQDNTGTGESYRPDENRGFNRPNLKRPGRFKKPGIPGRNAARTGSRIGARMAAAGIRAVIPLMSQWWFWVIVIVIILLLLLFPMFNKLTSLFPPIDSSTPPPTATPSAQLSINKKVIEEAVLVGENIEFKIKVESNHLAGEKVIITDQIPQYMSFVSADNNGQLKGNYVEWELTALKQKLSTTDKPIPPQTGPAPPGFGRPVQVITATIEQIKAELDKNSPDYSQYAEAVYNAGVKHKVDPAFIMAIWWMESHYSKVGGYHNNPGSIVYVRDGYLGMKKGLDRFGRTWATWDTFEEGIEAIARLISEEYYPQNQIDTWTIHSGIDENHKHQYHCRCDIGRAGQDIQTWNDYVNFYYGWIEVMNRITDGSFTIQQEVTLTLKSDVDKKWVTNIASAFAPGTGNISSNTVTIKIGDALKDEKPLTKKEAPPTTPDTVRNDLIGTFGITMNDFSPQYMIWAWEKLWNVNHTNFTKIVHGSIIDSTTPADTQQVGCPGSLSVLLGQFGDEQTWKHVFIHELGHVVANCTNPKNIFSAAFKQAFDSEKGVSDYGRGAPSCTRSDNFSEDFAETVAYYLNPGYQVSTVKCFPPQNPDLKNNYPLHYNFIKSILGDY